MALNGNFIPFQTIIESVYREVGYQTIDWTQAIEVVGETIGLIGALPAYSDITTNGLNSNPIPLEVVDFRVAIPTSMVDLKAVRKVTLVEVDDGDGGTDLKISNFTEMVEATDLFYQSIREQWNEEIPSGTYDYISLTQQDTLSLTGSSGIALITGVGDLSKSVIYDIRGLTQTADTFVLTNAAEYLTKDIILTSSGEDLIFTSNEAGLPFTSPIITNTTGDLSGELTADTISTPVYVYGQEYKVNMEAQYEYKLNDGYIYTNFKEGFIELVYTGYVVDAHGFPMIPDDPKFREAVKWALIRYLDYRKWRVGEIPRDVFQYSDQQRDWYIAAARSKASIPTIDKMESIKNMFLRSIPKVNEHSSYFKYTNVPEQRYNLNSSHYTPNYNRRR